MKKSKYYQYFHCFIVCILGPYAFWFSFQQNIVTILISAVFRGCGAYLIGRAYLRSGAYWRKYSKLHFMIIVVSYRVGHQQWNLFRLVEKLVEKNIGPFQWVSKENDSVELGKEEDFGDEASTVVSTTSATSGIHIYTCSTIFQ